MGLHPTIFCILLVALLQVYFLNQSVMCVSICRSKSMDQSRGSLSSIIIDIHITVIIMSEVDHPKSSVVIIHEQYIYHKS